MNAPATPRAVATALAASDSLCRRRAVWTAIAAVAALLLIYTSSVASMVGTWVRSETYAHGFFVAPVTVWLIWRLRAELGTVEIRPDWRAIPALAAVGFGWLLARLASAQVLELYLFVAMIPALLWGILGVRYVRKIAFPLAYLLLAVPFGDVLIPPLIDFTADFTVAALQATGIPVYREGNFFAVPSGNWSVVEACSGLRYLIASFTLGTVYAYLSFKRTGTRLLFIGLSIVVPIIANGLRAYMIVMIGHLSNMRLAAGVDHLIYGWIFFGIVMFLLGWIGSFWRDQEDQLENDVHLPAARDTNNPAARLTAPYALVGISVAAIWSFHAWNVDHRPLRPAPKRVEISVSQMGWVPVSTSSPTLAPRYVGAPSMSSHQFKASAGSVQMHIAYYRNQNNDSELINSGNFLVPKNSPVWRHIGQQKRDVTVGERRISVTQSELHSPEGNLLVWRWYWMGGSTAVNPYLVTAMLAWKRLTGDKDDMAEIVIAAPFDDDHNDAAAVLQTFMEAALSEIDLGLSHEAGE